MQFRTLIVATGLLLAASFARADFIFTTTRQGITSGMFAGDSLHTLNIFNDGNNGSGSKLATVTVQEWSQSLSVFGARDPNAPFFIRTWNGSNADLSNQADRQPGEVGSYVRFGPASQWALVSSSPAENRQAFTDGQSIAGGFTVSGTANLAGGGEPDATVQPLAYAVTQPYYRLLGYTVTATSETGFTETVEIDETPEPAGIGLLGFCVGALMRRRR